MRPSLRAFGHLPIRQQGRIQLRPQPHLVHLHADKHQLLTCIADALKPVSHNKLQRLLIFRPALPRDACPPAASQPLTRHAPRMRPRASKLWSAGQPEVALRTHHAREFVLHHLRKAGRMERTAGAIGKAGDAILFRLRGMLPAQLFEPARRLGGFGEIEQAGIQHLAERHLAKLRGHHFRSRVEGAQHAQQPALLLVADQIDFVNHQHITKLHLLDQQIHHATGILLSKRLSPGVNTLFRAVVVKKVKGIYNGHHGIEARHVREASPLIIGKGKGFRHRERLRDAGGLDHQLVKPPLPRQAIHLNQQILPQRAADTAVAHLHQFLVGA